MSRTIRLYPLFFRQPLRLLRPFSTDSKIPGNLVQSPNRSTTWSSSQVSKKEAMSGPRFEQTDFDMQPNPPSAQELIAAVPVQIVQGRKAVCNGGGGALGHPKVYINLDQGKATACGYCGLRFQQEHHH